MVEDKFLKESQIYQKLLDTAKKYGVADYIPGQSFDAYKDKMSAEDYEKSQKLLEYYGLQNSLTDRYDYSNKIIEQERFKALQENSIAKAMTM